MIERFAELGRFALLAALACAAPAQSFEVVTIKPSAPITGDRIDTYIRAQPGGQTFVGNNVPVRLLIKYSFKINDSQLVNAPAWIDSERFDFRAKADHPVTRAELPPLFQAMVIERFGLKFHHETRTLPAFVLAIDKGATKMKKNEEPDQWEIPIQATGGPGPVGVARSTGKRVPLNYLCWWLSQLVDKPVIDQTALTGFWDFTLQYVPDMMRTNPPVMNGQPVAVDGPSLYTALREQLGLRFESTKGPVEVMVIDHVDRPSAN